MDTGHMSTNPIRAAQTNRLCPFCTKELADSFSSDHVFGRAFGSRITVRACIPCNSTIGHDIEGPLHAPRSVHSFMRASAGLKGGRALEAIEKDSGKKLLVDWPVGGSRPRHPDVKSTVRDGYYTGSFEGTERQAREWAKGLRKKLGANTPSIDEILAAARPVRQSPVDLEMSLGMDLALAQRMLAKVGLAAGVWVWGDLFASTEVAQDLREFLGGKVDLTDDLKIDYQYLEVVDDILSRYPAGMPRLHEPSGPPGDQSRVIFGPVGHATTAVFVEILGLPTPYYGMIVKGTVPGRSALPTVVQEPLGVQADVWSFDDLLFSQMDPDEIV